jgi:prepilin-type N-terminal cleavage/methylation domain-containing protein
VSEYGDRDGAWTEAEGATKERPEPREGVVSSDRRASEPNSNGMTLIELLVAVSVASVLLAGVATVFVGTLRGVTTTTVKTATGADVRIAIEAMTRTLKVADVPRGEAAAFVSATTTGLSFYALLNRTGTASTTQPVPTLVQYGFSPATNCVNESQTPATTIASPPVGGPYYQWPAANTTTRCLLRTSTAPVFTYYPAGTLSATALDASAGLSSANLDAVRSVGLLLTATDPANPGIVGVPAENRVTLENLLVTDGS